MTKWINSTMLEEHQSVLIYQVFSLFSFKICPIFLFKENFIYFVKSFKSVFFLLFLYYFINLKLINFRQVVLKQNDKWCPLENKSPGHGAGEKGEFIQLACLQESYVSLGALNRVLFLLLYHSYSTGQTCIGKPLSGMVTETDVKPWLSGVNSGPGRARSSGGNRSVMLC